MMKLVAIILLSSVGYIAAQAWTDLKVTWDLSPFNQFAFAGMARQLASDGSLDSSKYTKMENFCAQGGTPFLGQRFRVKTNNAADPSVSLLFDINGFIAGIQVSILKTVFSPNNGINQHNLIVSDGAYWTQTAYFVQPSIICQNGRSAADFQSQGTGTGLYIQQASGTALTSMQIPQTQTALDSQIASGALKWTQGKCFVTMGLHYWYNLRTDMNCDDFLPMFLLYNGGKLNAFGWAFDTGSSPLTSPRYEHPTSQISFLFMNPTPQCLSTDPRFQNLNTMHIFFTSHPRFNDLC